MYREPGNEWMLIAANRLRHSDCALAADFAKRKATLTELKYQHLAHQYLSAEMVNLDLLITTLVTELRPDLATELRPDLVSAASTDCAEEAVTDTAPLSGRALFASRLAIFIRTARERVKFANNWELLVALLNERKLASEEMAQIDLELIPVLHKLGVTHHA
jgi:hypothetical protein